MAASYEDRYRDMLRSFGRGLEDDLSRATELTEEEASRLIGELLDFACRAQNSANIQLGRAGLRSLPREWLMRRMPPFEAELLTADPEWEGRRLWEVYQQLDPEYAEEFRRKLTLDD